MKHLIYLAATAEETVSISEDVKDLSEKVSSFQIKDYIPTIIEWGIRILVIILILFLGKKLIELALRLFDRVSENHHLDPSVSGFIRILLRWVMYILLACIILDYLDIGTASLVAVLGSAGLAVGLSLQGSLSNFAGSIIILVMQPFKVGDYIVTDAGEGTVKLIGLVYTTITTFDNKEIHIPNGNLANSNVTNLTANPTRTVCVKVGISYDSDIKKAKDLIWNMLENSDFRVPDTDVQVFVSSLGASSVDLEGRFWVKTEDYWTADRAMRENIKMIYDEQGIEIPFNQMDVHMR